MLGQNEPYDENMGTSCAQQSVLVMPSVGWYDWSRSNHAKEDIPTKEKEACAYTRISSKKEHADREKGVERKKKKRKKASHCPIEAVLVMVRRDQRAPVKDFFKKRRKPSASSSRFLVYTTKNDTETNRLAAVVGVKVDRSAVGRHRLKRQVLARVGKWPQAGIDVIVVARPGASGVPPRELDEEFKTLLKKVY